jgi:hypothetical protein
VSPRLVLLAAGAGLVVMGLVALVARRGDGPRYGGESRRSMAESAGRRLEQLRFLRTYTSGGGAGLSGPAGLSLYHSQSRQVAEQRMTLPELVASYREFTQAVADWWTWTRHGRRIVAGVDEVDRIADPAKVERFVNDIKTMFGTADCLYLVSVSEEALAVLDRRAVGAHRPGQHVRRGGPRRAGGSGGHRGSAAASRRPGRAGLDAGDLDTEFAAQRLEGPRAAGTAGVDADAVSAADVDGCDHDAMGPFPISEQGGSGRQHPARAGTAGRPPRHSTSSGSNSNPSQRTAAPYSDTVISSGVENRPCRYTSSGPDRLVGARSTSR